MQATAHADACHTEGGVPVMKAVRRISSNVIRLVSYNKIEIYDYFQKTKTAGN